MACDTENGPDALIELLKRMSLGDMFLLEDDFYTSPIYVKVDAYEFSIEHEVIPIAENDAFHGNEDQKAIKHFFKIGEGTPSDTKLCQLKTLIEEAAIHQAAISTECVASAASTQSQHTPHQQTGQSKGTTSPIRGVVIPPVQCVNEWGWIDQ